MASHASLQYLPLATWQEHTGCAHFVPFDSIFSSWDEYLVFRSPFSPPKRAYIYCYEPGPLVGIRAFGRRPLQQEACYRARTIQIIKQITTSVPISPYPNILAPNLPQRGWPQCGRSTIPDGQ